MNQNAILLVEDNPSDIVLTQRAMKKSNILNELVVAENGQEALDYLFGTGKYAGRDINEQPAFVLLDLKLPGMGGLDVLRQIRSHPKTSRLPVVILTTSKEEQDIAQSYDLGANSYIRKPVDFVQFVACMANLGQYWLIINEPPA